MFVRGLVLASALLIPSPVAPATLPLMVIQPQSIVQVICYGKGGVWAGTAFRIGPGGLGASVNHVTSSGGTCLIDGKPMNLAYKSPTYDFSEVLLDDGPYIPIDCGGFVKGKRYLGVGYARGLSTLTTVELTATGETSENESVLEGMWTVVPGMSGGVLIDEETGRAVGTINMDDFQDGLSWSVPLSVTPLCKKATA